MQTIQMDPGLAKEKYLQYRASCKGNPTNEDAAIMMGYKSLMKGQAVIDLPRAMVAGGLTKAGFPALAIARANWPNCFFEKRSGEVSFSVTPNWINGGLLRQKYGRHRCSLLGDPFPTISFYSKAKAMVPFIPPSIRPAAKIDEYFILWEAVWEPLPPVDPYLLSHLTGDLFAVMAQWDLTPLERAVMGSRITS